MSRARPLAARAGASLALVACSVSLRAGAVEKVVAGEDGVYGRLDGALAWSAGAGVERYEEDSRLRLRATAHYLWSAGVYVAHGVAFASDPAERQSLAFGVDVRPLFLPRFALNLEDGPAFADLLLDSISLNVGAVLGQPPQRGFASENGFEVGAGFGFPLSSSASGPWLEARVDSRWRDGARRQAFAPSLVLSFHGTAWRD